MPTPTGNLADQAAKAAFAKQFQRDRAKLAAMGIAIESRQPEYSSKPRDRTSRRTDCSSGTSRASACASSRRICRFSPRPTISHVRVSVSSTQSQTVTPQHVSRTTPRVPQTPIPGLGLDSIAPGLGTQTIPPALVRVVDSRRFAATVDVDGENINVAYTDSDDLAMFVLEHPGAVIVSPQEAVDAFNRRLQAASNMMLADRSSDDTGSATVATPTITSTTPEPEDADPKKNHQKKSGTSFQTGSEVDRRLRLMLFLSAHLGEEFSLAELAERFIGRPKSDDELKKYVNVIHKASTR